MAFQQNAAVSQGRVCLDSSTCCHTEIEVEDPTFYLTQSQYTDTGPTSPSTDPVTPSAWQGSHWSANFKSLVTIDSEKSWRKRDLNPGPLPRRSDRSRAPGRGNLPTPEDSTPTVLARRH